MNSLPQHILVHHFLEESRERHPEKLALVHGPSRVCYDEVNRAANQLAHWLLSGGLERGGRVVLLLENCLEYVLSYYGTLKAGGVVVPLNPNVKSENLMQLLQELDAEFVIGGANLARTLHSLPDAVLVKARMILRDPKELRPSGSYETIAWESLFDGSATRNPDLQIDSDDPCSIIYTSGSSGRPKGVMLSHANIVANTHAICESLDLTERDIQMVVLPFFYVMGQSLLNTHFAAGGRVVINNQFAYPASVVQQIISEKVTGFSGVPSTYAYLLYRSPLEKHRQDLTHLRYCSQAGGAMPRQLKIELRRVLPPHVAIYIMYGATEAAARLSYLEPGDFEKKMDTIGKPVRGVRFRIVDAQGLEVEAGRQGELVADGPNIMQGYWKHPRSTARVLDEDGYHTGDIAYQDSDGFYVIVGRKDELVKVGGHRINPEEIEEVLMASGFLIEAAVVGVPDPLLGMRLCALGVPRACLCDGNSLLSFCAARLPRHKLPAAILLLPHLPKSASGKTDRLACRRLACENQTPAAPEAHPSRVAACSRMRPDWMRELDR